MFSTEREREREREREYERVCVRKRRYLKEEEPLLLVNMASKSCTGLSHYRCIEQLISFSLTDSVTGLATQWQLGHFSEGLLQEIW